MEHLVSAYIVLQPAHPRSDAGHTNLYSLTLYHSLQLLLPSSTSCMIDPICTERQALATLNIQLKHLPNTTQQHTAPVPHSAQVQIPMKIGRRFQI